MILIYISRTLAQCGALRNKVPPFLEDGNTKTFLNSLTNLNMNKVPRYSLPFGNALGNVLALDSVIQHCRQIALSPAQVSTK